MQMTVKERIKIYIKSKGISIRKFEGICGLSYGYINNMRVSMQPDKVSNIALHFPDLNTGWLLTGEGKMLKESIKEKEYSQEPQNLNMQSDLLLSMQELISSQQRTIENLSITIKNLSTK